MRGVETRNGDGDRDLQHDEELRGSEGTHARGAADFGSALGDREPGGASGRRRQGHDGEPIVGDDGKEGDGRGAFWGGDDDDDQERRDAGGGQFDG